MFILVELQDNLQVLPKKFKEDKFKLFKRTLNRRYANKVVHNIGLVICVQDIIHCSAGNIDSEVGGANFKVRFNLVVFRPVIDEVIEVRVKSQSEDGIVVGTDFFSDIFITKKSMKTPSVFSLEKQQWYWLYDEENKMYIEKDNTVRVQIIEEKFTDANKLDENSAPYQLTATIKPDGLGPVHWW